MPSSLRHAAQWAVEVSSDDTRAAFELLGGAKSGAIHNAMIKVAAQPGFDLGPGAHYEGICCGCSVPLS
jgi:ATP-dependent DNA helicase DinG